MQIWDLQMELDGTWLVVLKPKEEKSNSFKIQQECFQDFTEETQLLVF